MDLKSAPHAVDILLHLRECPEHKDRVDKLVNETNYEWVDLLLAHDYISTDDFGLVGETQFTYTTFRLTAAGEMALAEFERQREQDAQNRAEQEKAISQASKEKRKDRRHDYLVAIISSIVGSLLTLFLEHFDDIVALVVQLIDQCASLFQ